MSALPPPTASGVRVAGDQFQWPIAWVECLRMYLDQQRAAPNPIVEVELEASDGMNLDDVVVRRRRPPHTFMPVKYAVDARDQVNESYLIRPARVGGTSVLPKIMEGWRRLSRDGQCEGGRCEADLVLCTNRTPDPQDPLVSCRDARTELLMNRAGQGVRPATRAKRAAAGPPSSTLIRKS